MSSGDARTGRSVDGGGAAGGSVSGSDPSVARPQPSHVAPRDQATRPDAPLTLSILSYEVLAPDRLQVRYAGGVPECYGSLDRAVVKEADHEVVLVLLARPPAGPADEPCPDIALVADTVVRLHAPLADRRVVDGVSGQVLRRGHADAGPDPY